MTRDADKPIEPTVAHAAAAAGAASGCGGVLILALAGCGDASPRSISAAMSSPEGALEQVPLGASQEQVLIVLGTPSTVATVSGEAFYYISQRAEQQLAFMPQEVTDQRVIAVYFDKNRRVERLANYGLKDGKVFDFVSRTTPTSGAELDLPQLHLRHHQAARAIERRRSRPLGLTAAWPAASLARAMPTQETRP